MLEAVEIANEKSLLKGLIACAVASVFFGSMFVPIKKYNAGDGKRFNNISSTFEKVFKLDFKTLRKFLQ